MEKRNPLKEVANTTGNNDSQDSTDGAPKQPDPVPTTSFDDSDNKENGFSHKTQKTDPDNSDVGCGSSKPKETKPRRSILKAFDPLYESPISITASSKSQGLRRQLIIEDSDDSDGAQSSHSVDVSDDDDDEGTFVDASTATDEAPTESLIPKNKNLKADESLLEFYTPEKVYVARKGSDTEFASTSEVAESQPPVLENIETSTSTSDQSDIQKETYSVSPRGPDITESEIVSAISRKLSSDCDIIPTRSKFTITESELENYNVIRERFSIENRDQVFRVRQESAADPIQTNSLTSVSEIRNISPERSNIGLGVDIDDDEPLASTSTDQERQLGSAVIIEKEESSDDSQESKVTVIEKRSALQGGSTSKGRTDIPGSSGERPSLSLKETESSDSFTSVDENVTEDTNQGDEEESSDDSNQQKIREIIKKCQIVLNLLPNPDPHYHSSGESEESSESHSEERLEKDSNPEPESQSEPEEQKSEKGDSLKKEFEENIQEEPQSEGHVQEKEPPTEKRVKEEPQTEEHSREEPQTEEHSREESQTEERVQQTPQTKESIQEKPQIEEPVQEKLQTDESVQEKQTQEFIQKEPQTEEPVKEDSQNREHVQENPQTEEPVHEEPQTEEPVKETLQAEEPVQEKPQTEELVKQDSQTREHIQENQQAERLVQKESQTEEPVEAGSQTEEPVKKDSQTREHVQQNSQTEELIQKESQTEGPVQEEPQTEESVKEDSQTREYIQEDSQTEEPVQEEPQTEEPIQEKLQIEKNIPEAPQLESELVIGTETETQKLPEENISTESDAKSQKIVSEKSEKVEVSKEKSEPELESISKTITESESTSATEPSASTEEATPETQTEEIQGKIPETEKSSDVNTKAAIESESTVYIQQDEDHQLDSGVDSIEEPYTKSPVEEPKDIEKGEDQEIPAEKKDNLPDEISSPTGDDRKVITREEKVDEECKTVTDSCVQDDERAKLLDDPAECKIEEEQKLISEPAEPNIEKTTITLTDNQKSHIKITDIDTLKAKMADLSEKLSEQQQENSDLKLQLNAIQQAKASLELEIRQKEEVIIKTQAESLKNEQTYKQEIKQLREKLKENSKLIEKDSSKELEDQLKEAKAKEAKAIAELNQRTKDDLNYQKIMEEYENTIATRFADFQKLKEEHETATRHLANIELAFSDVHQKYERTKALLEGFKTNEEALNSALQASEKTCKQHEEKYESLKAHAKGQIEKSNKEILALRDKYEMDVNKLKAIIKRLEIKCSSLEVSLQQKTEECAALSALCDEVTGKKV